MLFCDLYHIYQNTIFVLFPVDFNILLTIFGQISPITKGRSMTFQTIIITAILIWFHSLEVGGLKAEEQGKFSGKSYFEYFKPDNSLNKIEKFQFTRYYFTYDKQITENLAVRYRLDADRTADDKMRPFLKHAYLSWANLITDAKIYIGMQQTPNWSSYSEQYWGHRGVEKTIQDLHKVGSSADLGIGLVGNFSDRLGYHILLANGTGFSNPENDNYKKTSGLLWFKPGDNFIGTVYADFEPISPDNSNSTISLFGGMDTDKILAGLEFFVRSNGNPANGDVIGLSLFGTLKLSNGNIFGRYDISDPDGFKRNDNINYIIIGYEYIVDEKLKIMPNVRNKKSGDTNSLTDIHINFEFSF